jgi:hypothetical protein
MSYNLRHRPYRYAPPQMTWVGKGTGPLAWLMIAGVVTLAMLMAWWLH